MLHARDEAAATAVEYAIMVSLIAAVVVAVVLALGLGTKDLYCDTNDQWQQNISSTASDPC